jgi:hypothetical protein
MNAHNFYSTICDCHNTEAKCPDIINSRTTGWPPRGFFTENQGVATLLAVCKNPGHLLTDESALYMGRTSLEIADIHISYARQTFRGDNDHLRNARRSTIFHKNLVKYLSFFLDVPSDEVFNYAVYTNLVKCSTHGERDMLKQQTMKECFLKHFVREIEHFRPKALIAFGREVERFLLNAKKRQLHSLPVIYVKHPSYHYRRESEHEILTQIRTEVQQVIKTAKT